MENGPAKDIILNKPHKKFPNIAKKSTQELSFNKTTKKYSVDGAKSNYFVHVVSDTGKKLSWHVLSP